MRPINRLYELFWIALVAIASLTGCTIDRAEDREALSSSLRFYASFDESFDADFATGDGRVWTSPTGNYDDAQKGMNHPAASISEHRARRGNAAQFTEKSASLLFYPAAGNVAYSPNGFSGTVSLYLVTDPVNELEHGYTDPIQITDKAWNDAAFFLDFTQQPPRDFRLGVYSDYPFWNPDNIDYDDLTDQQRPLITLTEPPFNGIRPIHVVFTFDNINHPARPAVTRLYVDGELVGERRQPERFTWDIARTMIQIGINYIGTIDELAIFDRALTPQQIETLSRLEYGVGELQPAE